MRCVVASHGVFVDAARVGVADVGEPFDLGRHVGQTVKLGGGSKKRAETADLDRPLERKQPSYMEHHLSTLRYANISGATVVVGSIVQVSKARSSRTM